jgi:hypothetical protein
MNAVGLRGTVSVRDLAALLDVSEQTVRRIVRPQIMRHEPFHAAACQQEAIGEIDHRPLMGIYHAVTRKSADGREGPFVPVSLGLRLRSLHGRFPGAPSSMDGFRRVDGGVDVHVDGGQCGAQGFDFVAGR